MRRQLEYYLQAGYSGIAIITSEESRAEAEISAVCTAISRKVHVWSSTEGLVNTEQAVSTSCPDPDQLFLILDRHFANEDPRHVVVLRDIQLHLDQNDPLLVRRFKDMLKVAKAKGHTMILLGCRLKLPPELDHEITRLDFDLPDAERLGVVLDNLVKSAGITPPKEDARQAALQNALGLTTTEAENAFALAYTETRSFDHRVIAREKGRALKRSGLVEVVETSTGLEDIGGLGLLKEWLMRRATAFGPAAKSYGLPSPKGLLIVGIPGTGKSLTAKATANAFDLPLLRLDMGRVFGGIVGQSEANLRAVIQTAEAIAPCVLWIDEIEKGFSGSKSSGSTDGGTSSRVFGSFLSWMQEKQKPVFVVATANDVTQLPPEFLRKGRFDEMFFVDLPDAHERTQIWDIVIARYGRRPVDYDTVVLSRACEQFTGAEIEAVFVDAMHEAFADNREPGPRDILDAMTRTAPLAQMMDGQISALRHWAKGRAREASASITSRLPKGGRRVSGAN